MRGRSARVVIATLVGAALAATAACGSADPGKGAASPSAVTATESRSSPTNDRSSAESAELGEWTAGPVPRSAFEKTMKKAGFEETASTFFDGLEPADTLALELALQDGFWTLVYINDDGVPAIADRGTYERAGGRLIVSNASGVNVFRFSFTDQRLELRFVSTTEPDYRGAPAEMFQRAWYTTTPFTRVDP